MSGRTNARKLGSQRQPLLEIKSTGGYIVAPPSVHPSGGLYRWDLGALASETPIADAPAWLLSLACGGVSKPALAPAVGPAADSFLGVAFAALGWLGRELHNGAVAARCPWLDGHTDQRGDGHDSSTVLLLPTHEARIGAFKNESLDQEVSMAARAVAAALDRIADNPSRAQGHEPPAGRARRARWRPLYCLTK